LNERIKKFLKRLLPAPVYETLVKIKNRIYRPFYKIRDANTLIFQVHITYHCNLKYRCCSHFSPIADEYFLDVDSFDKDLKRLSDLGGKKIRQIDLLGGEPLLHPQINAFLAIARKRFPCTRVVLFTNGILLQVMQETFWRECKNSNIIVAVSHYPSVKLDVTAIDETASKYGVTIVHNNLGKDVFFGHFRFNFDGGSNGELNIKKCPESKVCHCLDGGKMYLCYIPALIHLLNKKFGTQIPVAPADYIDIYKAKDVSEIIKFLKKAAPFCDYCSYEKRELVKWGLSKKTIDEWT
jgi:hypothetical protein